MFNLGAILLLSDWPRRAARGLPVRESVHLAKPTTSEPPATAEEIEQWRTEMHHAFRIGDNVRLVRRWDVLSNQGAL